MREFLKVLLMTWIILAGVEVTMAADITADTLIYDGKTQVVTATGDVVIRDDKGTMITGEKASYDFQSRVVHICGSVIYNKNAIHATAEEMTITDDHTVYGVGSVALRDTGGNHTLRGDEVTYNSDTGFGKIKGNGYFESNDGYIAAPYIDGNVKEISIKAHGGVKFSFSKEEATGYSDEAIYTRSGIDGTDGKLVLRGNAHAVQRGNVFDGPELIIYDEERIVETGGRSTIVIQTGK